LGALVHSMLYLVDRRGRSYAQISSLVAALTPEERQEILARALRERGEHDEWLRAQRVGYTVWLDVFADVGALRDLHRHRRCVQLIPDLKLDLGLPNVDALLVQGLGDNDLQVAAQRGLIDAFGSALGQAFQTTRDFPYRERSPYLLPLAARQRILFKMDLTEAVYIIKLRSRVGGHSSYRTIAYTMYRLVSERYPCRADAIRATNPQEVVDLLNRCGKRAWARV
jgi:hypothetical protein